MKPSYSAISANKSKIPSQYKNDNECKVEYVLTILGLENLIPRVMSLKLTLQDLLLLSKQDLTQLNFELVQRNRLMNFIQSFQKVVKKYSLEDIIYFFNQNRQFIFIQIQQPITYESACLIIAKYINENQVTNQIQDYTPLSHRRNAKDSKIIEQKHIQKSDSKVQDKMIKLRNKYKEESYESMQSYNQRHKKELTHSQTVDPYLKKGSKINNNPFYQNYLLINKESENILTSLRKSREESEIKHMKYASLLISNKDSTGVRSYHNSNNSHEITQNKVEVIHTKNKLVKLREINTKKEDVIDSNKVNEDIDKLYDIISRKEALIKHLNECNKSITEKKMILTYLEDDTSNEKGNIQKKLKRSKRNDDNNVESNQSNDRNIHHISGLEEVNERNEYESQGKAKAKGNKLKLYENQYIPKGHH